jgi:hypothetical protein
MQANPASRGHSSWCLIWSRYAELGSNFGSSLRACTAVRIDVSLPRLLRHGARRLRATPVHSYAELMQVIRARIRELQITHETVDAVSGLQSGYAGKLLCDPPMKRIGRVTWDVIFDTLGLKIVVAENRAQTAKLRPRLVKRKAPAVATHWRQRRKSAQPAAAA